jgi:hypothetical protein
MLTDPTEDADVKGKNTSNIQPVARIDAFSLKNLATDIQHFKAFADGTGVG